MFGSGCRLEYSSAMNSSECSEGYDGDHSMTTEEDGGQKQKHYKHLHQRRKGQLLPCSIRCPGSNGEIPTLQCQRCLCLYHANCLGLKNQNFRNFYCSVSVLIING